MFAAIYVLAENGQKDFALSLANSCTAVIFLASVLILIGGIMRPLQKSFYHYALEGNDRYRRYFGASPMSLWVWVDGEGRDRDA